MKIYFIRHGKTIEYEDNDNISIDKSDYMLLKSYRSPEVDVVYSSPSKICLDTAKEMFTTNYVETIDGLTPINKEANSVLGIETMKSFKRRCIECFDIIMWDAISKNIDSMALVLHEENIKVILDEYSMPHMEYDFWNLPTLSGYEGDINSIFWHSNKCICNILKYDGER